MDRCGDGQPSWYRHRLQLQPRAPHEDEAHPASPLRHFFIRELVEQQLISVPFVKTTDNWANFFTKPLKPKHLTAMRNAIVNIDSGQ